MIERHDNNGRLSKAVIANGFVFLSGIVARDRSGSVRDQTVDILAQIEHYLALAGTDKTRLVTSTVWLKDMSTFNEMNEAWEAWVDPERTPARATVEASLAFDSILVEVQVQALV